MVLDAWKNFELSGKVMDYLAYRQSAAAEDNRQSVGHRESEKSVFLEKGMGSYGTEHSSDGNGVKGNADWGIR